MALWFPTAEAIVLDARPRLAHTLAHILELQPSGTGQQVVGKSFSVTGVVYFTAAYICVLRDVVRAGHQRADQLLANMEMSDDADSRAFLEYMRSTTGAREASWDTFAATFEVPSSVCR